MEIIMSKAKKKIAAADTKIVSSKKPLKIINHKNNTIIELQSKLPAEIINCDNKAEAALANKLPRSSSKQGIIIKLLQSPAGATVEDLATATGWQKHSVQGVMSGVLKKKLGLKIESSKEDGGRVYRIAEGA